MAGTTSRWNTWILAGAAMLAPAMMFAGSSAAAEPTREASASVEEAPSECLPLYCGTDNGVCRRTCGFDWSCFHGWCLQL